MRWIQRMVKEYGWIHLGIGLVGNFCFFVGSIFFLWEHLKRAGVWLFILGSGGMLIGSAGRWAASIYAKKNGLESGVEGRFGRTTATGDGKKSGSRGRRSSLEVGTRTTGAKSAPSEAEQHGAG